MGQALLGLAADARPYAELMVSEATAVIAENPTDPLYYNYRALAHEVLGEGMLAQRDRSTALSLGGWWVGSLALPLTRSGA